MAKLITALALLATTSTAYADDLVPEGTPAVSIDQLMQIGPSVVAEEAPEPEPVEAPPRPVFSAVWDRLAMCESSGYWRTNTGNGYYGGLQQDMTFWRRYGGTAYASRPDLASREAQITVAIRGQAVQGWGAWPACSRRLGLR